MKTMCTHLAIAATLAFSASAHADPIVYATPGVENTGSYSFTAKETGDIIAYFTGDTAAYQNELGLLVNGASTGQFGLSSSSAYGTMINFGTVQAGATLVFELITTSPTGIGPWYSDKSMNNDGVQHIYSYAYGGDSVVPAGTYVAFEDLPNGGNLNYNDETFVFTNVALAANPVPEPTSIALLLIGAAGLGFGRHCANARAKRAS